MKADITDRPALAEALRTEAAMLRDSHRPGERKRCAQCFERWPCTTEGTADLMIQAADELDPPITALACPYCGGELVGHPFLDGLMRCTGDCGHSTPDAEADHA